MYYDTALNLLAIKNVNLLHDSTLSRFQVSSWMYNKTLFIWKPLMYMSWEHGQLWWFGIALNLDLHAPANTSNSRHTGAANVAYSTSILLIWDNFVTYFTDFVLFFFLYFVLFLCSFKFLFHFFLTDSVTNKHFLSFFSFL